MSDAEGPRVCLVDDDESVRKSLTRLLGSAGFQVDAFSDADTFLQHLYKHSTRVVILDIWTHNTTAMGLLAHLCAKSPLTRVIFIAGPQGHTAEARVMKAGAFAFFIKPFDNKQFLAAVRRAFNNHH